MPESHPFWALEDEEAFYAYMARAVPQCDNLRAALPHDTVLAFLSSRLDRFPIVQHAQRLVKVYGDGAATSGVALLGDAAHAFPPGA
jgi:2-polyprenyl-6-methoxyphenol hydroxylase-like FAD-dependent oxidoreductase